MSRYPKHLARKVADATSEYLSSVAPLLRKRLSGLRTLAGHSVRAAAPVVAGARSRFPRFSGAVETAAPRAGLAAVLLVAVLVVVFMANFASTGSSDNPSGASAVIGGQRDTEDQSSRDQERGTKAEQPAEKKPAKPMKAKSGWAAPSTAEVSDTYGPRGWREGEMHWGMDFAADKGDKIYAPFSGTVIMAQRYGGYGNCVVIKHAGGVQTLYGHFSKLKVEPGEKVKTGDLLGKAGSTGDSTGPHLHFEVTVHGEYTDPAKFLKKKGVNF
ncbi:M23 family metallopeptidase [Phytomonospora sp. NPDC050363]|uniref:M23 family metallopeptidase n=1 Tax=Phytomonospora sp. NPDC050363 TaxID=3155642 RepID=UPI0033E10E08